MKVLYWKESRMIKKINIGKEGNEKMEIRFLNEKRKKKGLVG
jgi:hypothetical protein